MRGGSNEKVSLLQAAVLAIAGIAAVILLFLWSQVIGWLVLALVVLTIFVSVHSATIDRGD